MSDARLHELLNTLRSDKSSPGTKDAALKDLLSDLDLSSTEQGTEDRKVPEESDEVQHVHLEADHPLDRVLSALGIDGLEIKDGKLAGTIIGDKVIALPALSEQNKIALSFGEAIVKAALDTIMSGSKHHASVNITEALKLGLVSGLATLDLLSPSPNFGLKVCAKYVAGAARLTA